MSFTPEQVAELKAPLHKASVKERKAGNGMMLSYVEAWHAIAEANRIFGFDRWDRETVDLVLLGEPRLTGDKWRVGYRAKVKITVYSHTGDPTVREGCGFGSGIDKDVDQAHESALKEAESDAMKRALMTFGNPFGLALYDKTQANVVNTPAVTKPEGVISGTDLAEELASNLLKGCGSKELLKDAWDKNEAGWKKVLDEPSFLRVKGLCIHLAKQFAEPQREAA